MGGEGRQRSGDVEVLGIAWDAAIVLQADLAGFSRLAAELGQQGPQGAEELSRRLEGFFAAIIGEIEAAGGLVAGFAGDAVIGIWPGERDATVAMEAARRAHAALPDGLEVRVSVASGGAGIDRFTLGETDEIWLATGPAARMAADLNGQAAPGATLLRAVEEAGAAGASQQARLIPRHDRTPLTRVWSELSGKAGGAAFRDLTILSVDLGHSADAPRADPPSAPPDAREVARRLGRISRHVSPWGGLPVNMMSEQKGMVLHVVFGLPPLGPSGRELRAMRAAAAIAADDSLGCPVGIVDGRMFVSPHGTDTTRTVSAMGWPSSLATRLMQASDGRPLVALDTVQRAAQEIATGRPMVLAVKGWNAPVTAVPIEPRGHAATDGAGALLADWLRAPGMAMPVRVLSGPRGCGRSHHMRALRALARSTGWQVLAPPLRPDGARLPYDGIGRVAAEAMAATCLPPPGGEAEAALAQLGPLQDLLPASDPPPRTGEALRKLIEDAIFTILARRDADAPPLLIALDDAQDLDRSSGALLGRLAQAGVRVVCARRTSDEAPPDSDRHLAPLDGAEAARLIREATGAREVEQETTKLLHDLSRGNPLYLRDLVHDLSGSGRLTVSAGVLRLPTAEPADSARRSLAPLTLRELAASRLDRCAPEDRLVLSLASVLGQRFTAGAIADLPDAPPRAAVDVSLHRLAAMELVRLAADGTATFRDDLLREAAYDALPFAQRRRAHRHMAERSGASDLAEAARHWSGADRPDEAFACHEELAQRAAALFAQDEAIAHAAQARLIAGRHDLPLSPERRARLLMTEGSAALEAVELRMAEARLTELLTEIGRPQPRSAVAQAAHLLPALARQGWHRLRGGARPQDLPHGAMAATAHKNLAEIAYFEGRLGEVLLHTLHSLNLAERIGLTSEIVAGYSALSIGFETSGLPRVADFYIGRARETARAGGDPHDLAFASLVSLVLFSGRAAWPEADAAAQDAMAGYKALGAGGRYRQSAATLLHSRLARGTLGGDDPLLGALESDMDSRTSAQIRVWIKTARIGASLLDGACGSAEDRHALAGLAGHPQLNAADEVLALCTLALTDRLTGDDAGADARAARALALIHSNPPAAWHLGGALRWLCCAGVLGGDAVAARDARRALAQFARRMPVAEAAARFFAGFDTPNVAKRTALQAAAAGLSERRVLVQDGPVLDALRDRRSGPTP